MLACDFVQVLDFGPPALNDQGESSYQLYQKEGIVHIWTSEGFGDGVTPKTLKQRVSVQPNSSKAYFIWKFFLL